LRRLRSLLVLALIACLWVTALAQAEPTEIVIVHTNDTHARLQPIEVDGEQRGGTARIAAFVNVLNELYGGRVLWLDGGDTTHGTNVANLFYGESVIDVLNMAGVDAMAIGNHDFNYGQDVLRARIAQANFPVLAANVVYTATGESFADAYAIFDVQGVKVAVLGLSTQDTPIVTHPKNVVGLSFLDPVEVARELVPVLRSQADLVVVLSHIGFDEDVRLARSVPGIDLIVGGHSHTRLDEPVLVGDTIIVQANEYGKFLGFVELTVDNGRIVQAAAALLPITGSAPVDLAVQARIDAWESQLDAALDVVVGTSLVELNGERQFVRTGETNLGNFVADVLREAVGADIGLTNGGGIRASIDTGDITLREIYTVLPFDNVLVGVELTGAQILAALEHSVSAYPEQLGGFLQVSGLSFTYDATKPAGQRVVEVTVGGQPLDLNKVYRVATNDFLAAGGDGYEMFLGARQFYGSQLADGEFLRDVVAAYILEHGVIAPQVEGRIRVIE